MLKKHLLLFVLIFPVLVFSQKPNLRIGAQLLRSVHTELDFSISHKKTIGFRFSHYIKLHE